MIITDLKKINDSDPIWDPNWDPIWQSLSRLHQASFFRAWSEKEIKDMCRLPHTLGWVAIGEGNHAHILGFLLVSHLDEDAEIITLCVDRANQRRGVALNLLDHGFSHLKERGVRAVFLEVAKDNEAAIALYEKLGFVKQGVRKSYYQSKSGQIDAIILKALLKSEKLINEEGNEVSKSMSRIEKICTEKGMRMTDQRRVVAQILSQATDHPDVEELYRRAALIDPNISLATVYRTVRLFEEAGVVERHDFGDGRSRYEEAGDDHHDHLINIKTGEVIEFFDAEIEAMKELLAKKLGFKLVGHKLELYGMPIGSDEESHSAS